MIPTVVTPISDVTVLEDAADTLIELSAVFTDAEDGAGLTLTVQSNSNTALCSATLVGTTLTLSFLPDQYGTATIVIRATDTEGLYVEDSFLVTVTAVTDAPTTVDLLHDNPFEKITVSPGVLGGAEVAWVVKFDLPWPEPWTFRVDGAYTAAGDWVTLDTVSGDWSYVDPTQYKFDFMTEAWYRVVLIDGNSVGHIGDPVHVGTFLDRRDWVLAKEVCRRAKQRMRIRTGREGHLYKRRGWGELCTTCGNEITGQETNSQCATCFGVGVVGGYYDPVSMWVEMNNEDILHLSGDKDSQRYLLRHPTAAVNFPKISPYDIWRDLRSGKMWAIQPNVRASTTLRGIPILVEFQMQPIEVTDVVYDLGEPA